MTELSPAPQNAHENPNYVPGDDTLENILAANAENQNSTQLEASTETERPALSPMAARIRKAANRVSGFLEKRAINKAHTDALAEYRTEHNADYTDHVANMAESVNHLGEPIEAQFFAKRALKTEHDIADREERIEKAKETVQKIGRAARTAKYVSTGLATMTGEAAKSGANKAVEAISAQSTTVMNKGELVAGKVGQKLESGIESGISMATGAFETTRNTFQSLKEWQEVNKQKAARNKETALARKYERYAKGQTTKQKLGRFAAKAYSIGEERAEQKSA